MRRVVADSSVWIDYFRTVENRETSRLGSLISVNDETDLLIVPDLVLYEVLQGAPKGAYMTIDRLMRSFVVETAGGEEAVVAAADRYRALRRNGITIRKSPDVLIASWCLDNDAALLHRDRDFRPFEDVFGLRTA